MNIAIDGNEANTEERVGIGEYAYQVIKQLYNYRLKHKFVIFLKNPPKNDLPIVSENWEYQIIGPKPFWTQLALPIKLLTSRNLDVIFSPTHYAPRFSPIPSVISIMDLSFIRYPKLFNRKDQLQLKRWTKYSIRQAKYVLTISQFSKNQIIDFYKADSNKIYVTYPGYKKEIYRVNYAAEEINQVKKKYGLSNYLMFVGTIQPRKNIQRLVIAFSKLVKNFPDLKLVIIGKKGWLYEDIFKMMENKAMVKKIVYLGYIEDIQIAKLYNGASCFVLPSLYEGFGLTVIEAMACGCPVIVSNISSLPEVAGNAAIYVEPTSIESIVSGINGIIRQDQQYYREDRIKKGLTQVKKYSWENCGLKTLEVLEQSTSRQ